MRSYFKILLSSIIVCSIFLSNFNLNIDALSSEEKKIFAAPIINGSESAVVVSESDEADNTVVSKLGSQLLYLNGEENNLISNGDFEIASSGNCWNSLLNSSFISLSDAVVRSGNKSLRFYADGSKKIAQMTMKLNANTNYVFSLSLHGEYLTDTNYGDLQISLLNPLTNTPLNFNSEKFSYIFPPSWDATWHRRAVEFNSGELTSIIISFTAQNSAGYIDDMTLCLLENATSTPQTKDKAVDPLFKTITHSKINNTIVNSSVTCKDENNLLLNSDFSYQDDSFWDDITRFGCVNLNKDLNNANNGVLNYDSSWPRNNNCVKWVDVEHNTDYTIFIKIRGERQGNGGFTIVTECPNPKRVVKYIPDRFDGVWQTFCVNINTKDDIKIGFAVIDSGGAFSIDDAVICKSSNAVFTSFSNGEIVNGNAETGKTDGWSLLSDKPFDAIHSNISDTVQSVAHRNNSVGGSYYFYAPWSHHEVAQTLVLEKNKTYIFEMDYYVLNGGGYVEIRDNDAVLANITTTNAGNWNNTKAAFAVGENSIITVKIFTGYAAYSFDNARVYSITSNIGVVNGNAESSTTLGWDKSKTEANSFTVVKSAETTTSMSLAHTMISNAGDCYFHSWGYNNIYQTIELKPNTTYGIRLRYYATNGNASLSVFDNNVKLRQVSNSKLNEWTWGYTDFKTNAGIVTVSIHTGWANYGFDDLEIFEIKNENSLLNGDMSFGYKNLCTGWESQALTHVESADGNYIKISGGYDVNTSFTLSKDTLYTLSFTLSSVGTVNVEILSADNSVILAKGNIQGENKKKSIVFASENYENLKIKFDSLNDFTLSNVRLTKTMYCENIDILSDLQESDSFYTDLRQGIRFKNIISSSLNDMLYIDNIEYSVKEIGFICSAESNLPSSDLTKDLLTEELFCGGIVARDKVNETLNDSGYTNSSFSALISGIPKSGKNREFVSQTYIICENKNGDNKIFYSNLVSSNVFSIYQKNGPDYYSTIIKQWLK